MGTAAGEPRALPLLAAFSADAGLLQAVVDRWLAVHGPQLAAFGPYPFTFSDYYEKEMGAGLRKLLVVGAAPVPAGALAGLKRESNAWEAEHAGSGTGARPAAAPAPGPGPGAARRRVNLDPGLLDAKRVVLATTKDAAHRLYLRDGIFAEVTLRYHDGGYQPEAWTYPDFRQAEMLAFFNVLRPQLLKLATATG